MSEKENETNGVVIYNSTQLITQLQNNQVVGRSEALKSFKDFIKNDFVDGVDFGQIPGTDKPTLLKPGYEKIQFYLGLTPMFKLINRTYLPNQEKIDKVYNQQTKKYDTVKTVRNYYAWEWACELYHDGIKVAEGVGCANTEERKYVSQYAKSETPDSLANTVMKIAKKRAQADAILNVGGISDMYTVDLEDNEGINKLKVNKENKTTKISKDQIKTIYATMGALQVTDNDIADLLKSLKITKIAEAKPSDTNKIIEEIKKIAKERKKNQANEESIIDTAKKIVSKRIAEKMVQETNKE